MRTLRLTETQIYLLRQALDNSSAVLREIKANKLSGAALEQMKTLEGGVAHLEIVCLAATPTVRKSTLP